jgi:hypothetical protein
VSQRHDRCGRGIFAFGDVAFQGSLGANPPTRPVVAVALMR